MLSSDMPCQTCLHKEICMYREEVSAAYCSLERGSYIVPEHGDRAPGDLNTCMMPYKARKLLLFSVSCRYFDGHRSAESWDAE